MKQKLSHIWLYYKWYIIGAAVLLLLLGNHLWEIKAKEDPDHQVAVVTGGYVSEGCRDALARQLEQLWQDRDGDGKVKVTVNFYQYDAETAKSMDTASFMASAVQLAADFKLEISSVFFTDCPELLLDNDLLESYGPVADTCLTELGELAGFAVLGYEDSEQIRILLK